MQDFQDFIRSFGPQHIIGGFLLNMAFNSLMMWFAVNRLGNPEQKVPLVRCAVCALLLYLVSSIAIALLMIHIPLIVIGAVLFWLIGSMAVIGGVFELTHQSGFGILVSYLMLLVAVHTVIKHVLS